jgi:membrane protease YdiL (CAAX protease family)
VLLDRVRGTAGRVTPAWWTRFGVVFVAVVALSVWGLLAGDARTAEELVAARPVGLSVAGIIGALLAAAACAFIFASAAASKTPALHSIARWRAPLRWWAIAAFLPAALLGISILIARITGDAVPRLATPPGFVIRSILFTLLVVGIGEETGWRGWMLPELQKRFSPLSSSLLLGVVWGLWHFPLFVIGAYPGGPDAVLEYLFLGPLIAILFTWLYNRTGGIVLLTILLHTAINNSQRVLPTTTLFPVLLTGLIMIVIFTDRMWRRRVET